MRFKWTDVAPPADSPDWYWWRVPRPFGKGWLGKSIVQPARLPPSTFERNNSQWAGPIPEPDPDLDEVGTDNEEW